MTGGRRSPPRRARRTGRDDGRGEEGMVTAFVVVFMLALLLLAGLVIDGGLTLAARVDAADEAQAAARAGAQAINVPVFRATGQVTLDPGRARAAADAYLAETGHSGTVTVSGDSVAVVVGISQPMQILTLAGIKSLHVTGHATATIEHSVEGPGS